MHRNKPFWGNIHIVVISANPVELLRSLNDHGVKLFQPVVGEDLSVSFYIKYSDFKQVVRVIQKRGDRLVNYRRYGILWNMLNVFKRPVLLVGLIIICSLSIFLPGRILFIQVMGNSLVPEDEIISLAEYNGMSFGTPRKQIRSEQVKNLLLSKIPRLEWVGVNTSGCVAKISVKERMIWEDKQERPGISSIIAAQSGIITDITITRGTSVCKVGQAVEKGDLLVSGYNEGGICLYATEAEAEVYGETKRKVCVLYPNKCLCAKDKTGVDKKISVIFGKKRINFYKGSGIYDASCDKMYAQYYIMLPGGWQLPVSIVVEKIINRDFEEQPIAREQATILLEQFADQYLKTQMIAGRIVDKAYELYCQEDTYRIDGTYLCTELIGQTHFEEITDHYGENH